jgi:hypothetical protein
MSALIKDYKKWRIEPLRTTRSMRNLLSLKFEELLIESQILIQNLAENLIKPG